MCIVQERKGKASEEIDCIFVAAEKKAELEDRFMEAKRREMGRNEKPEVTS